jgi:hypothetical protein
LTDLKAAGLARRSAFVEPATVQNEITSQVFVSQAFVIVCLFSSEVRADAAMAAENRTRRE